MIEGALRYGMKGGAIVPVVVLPLVFLAEWWRAEEFGPPPFDLDHVTLPFGLQVLIGLVVGWLVDRLRAETAIAEARAAEAEDLRDRLGHRADVLEAVNRAARALGSSLDQQQAFAAFRNELSSMVSFDRLEVHLAGEADTVFATGGRVAGEGGEEIVAPLALADRALGTLTVARDDGPEFTSEEVEMRDAPREPGRRRRREHQGLRSRAERRRTSCAGSRRSAPTSCPWSRMSCGRRWPP